MKEEDSKENLTKIISNNQNEEDTEVSVKVSVWFHELRDFTEDIIIDENVIPTGVQAGQVLNFNLWMKVQAKICIYCSKEKSTVSN